MKFGVNTFIWTAAFDASSLHLLPVIKSAGFDGFEVPIFDATSFAAAEIRKGAAAHGLECTVCSIFDDNMSAATEDAAVRKQTLTRMRDYVKAVAEAGSKILAGPLYTPLGRFTGTRRTPGEWKHVVAFYQELGPTLAEYGVNITLEPLNRFETYFLNTAADAAALCDEIGHPNVGILFDTFHANIEEKDVAAGYRTVARHLKHVHTCENDRGTPGTGHVDWPGVFQALRDIHYDGWITIESFGFAIKEIAAAASIWRNIAPTPESIAFDGLKFLKQHLG